jgi:O-methyltransferase domain
MTSQTLTAGPTPNADTAWRRLHDAATARYRASGRFAWHFARGKLGRDPVFRGMLERGDMSGRTRIVDIGSGQSLLASLFESCNELVAAGAWPAGWPAAPRAVAYTGIELMPRDVDRARAALAGLKLPTTFLCADMREAPLPACDLVVILDVLHYVDHAAQEALLVRVRDALGPQGRLLLRIGDMASGRGFAVSQWVDRVVTMVRGHSVPPTWGRTVAEWSALLQRLGFAVQPVPMSEGTPFANVLLVADRAPAAGAGTP